MWMNCRLKRYLFYPQIELGKTITEYELGKEAQAVEVVNGIANGLTSVSPIMTILTDTEGVTVECEYNRDINKVIADLYNKING